MAVIYKSPIEAPEIDFSEVSKYRKDIKDHTNRLKEWCIKDCIKKYRPTENVGEVVSFQVADGYAEYMVRSIIPLELIHLEYWDAYSFEYIHRLNKDDILKSIQHKKYVENLFG